MKRLALLVASCVAAAPAAARTIRVAKDGSGDYKKTGAALDAAQPGDEVVDMDVGLFGSEIAKAPGGFVVKRVVPGGGAEKAGISSGDTIVMVDDQDVSSLKIEEMIPRLRGKPGTSVRVHVQRPGASEVKRVEVVRAARVYPIVDERSKINAALDLLDLEAAFKWAQRLADKGDVFGQGFVGRAYYHGWGVGRNVRKAVKWLKAAADGGDTEAQAYYGWMLLAGKDVPLDYSAAARYLGPASSKGNAWAATNLGYMYAVGQGVAKDTDLAKKLLQRGIDGGIQEAQGYLNSLNANIAAAREKQAVPAAAPAPASPPPGVSRQEIKELMAEALREQQASQPAVQAPEERFSDADAPNYSKKPRPDDLAVVIGIEKYASLPPAAYAEHDARAVRAHLVALGYPERNIFALTGARATKSAFIKELEARLRRMVKPDSNVFVYYSGHGAPDPRTGDAYLVPYDGDPEFLEETGYSLKRLYSGLGALKAERVIVALDSCFSGAGGRSVLAKGVRPLVSKVAAAPQGDSGLAVLTAAGGGEISGSLDEQGHGLFTYYLLKGLNSGAVTLGALHDYIGPKVADEARRHNRDQMPQLMGKGAAEAALAR